MTTEEKCKAILRFITEQTREEDTCFCLGWDWGKWTLTVTFPDGSHSHVGAPEPEGTFEVMIDQLHELLINRRGLSRVR
jgi:hypothetical protein